MDGLVGDTPQVCALHFIPSIDVVRYYTLRLGDWSLSQLGVHLVAEFRYSPASLVLLLPLDFIFFGANLLKSQYRKYDSTKQT